jgi:adenylate cyclase
VRDKLLYAFDDMGEQQVKNVARPIRVFALDMGAIGALAPTEARVSELHGAANADATLAIPLPDKPSIAVLPFTNMSGDPEQDYFADGMVEEIITDLSRIRWLFVIARNSSFTYKGRAVDVKQVGTVGQVNFPERACREESEASTGRSGWSTRHSRIRRRGRRSGRMG